MEDTREYKVTIKKGQNIDDFYTDIEESSSLDNVPDRKVEVALRRPISRSTNYYLTEDEVEKLRNDPRVADIGLPVSERLGTYEKFWNQTATFDKDISWYRNGGSNFSAGHKQWGLPRVIKGSNYTCKNFVDEYSPGVPGNANDTPWGLNGTSGAGSHYLLNETISTTSSGKNVDVIITDEHINPNHPEFWTEVNPTTKPQLLDGSQALVTNNNGHPRVVGNRVTQFNWFVYNSVLGYNSNPSEYKYWNNGMTGSSLHFADSGSGKNHGTHVAGTVAGNTNGWARDANIYYMGFLDDHGPVTNWTDYMFDYIRYWHKNKEINPETGRRNPTIVNASWGSGFPLKYPSTSSDGYYRLRGIRYRNNSLVDLDQYAGNDQQVHSTLEQNGFADIYYSLYGLSGYRVPYLDTSITNEIEDMIDDGVIFVSAAGNDGFAYDIPDGEDYDNYITLTRNGSYAGALYPWRGSSPAATATTICVGNIDRQIGNNTSTDLETKSQTSCFTERVDIYAPGSEIMSAITEADYQRWDTNNHERTDVNGAEYLDGAVSGTSMASPQVAGVLACLAEQEPDMNQADALQYLIETSTSNVGTGSAASPWTSPYRNLGFPSDNHSDSNNRFLKYVKKRPEVGQTYPHPNHKNRKPADSGVKYPRSRTRVTNPVPS